MTSSYNVYPVDPPAPAPAPAKPRRKTGWYVAGIITTAVVSFALGTAGQAPTEPAPEVTVTAEAEPAPEVTVTAEPETVEVEVTPTACDLALTRAEEIFGVTAEFAGAVSESMAAAAALDAAGVDAATATIEGLNGQIEAIDYNGPAAECRAGL